MLSTPTKEDQEAAFAASSLTLPLESVWSASGNAAVHRYEQLFDWYPDPNLREEKEEGGKSEERLSKQGYAISIDGILTPEECQSLIGQSEQHGYVGRM